MIEEREDDIPQLTIQNEVLTSIFTEEEYF
jgi:hypothetical protein